MSTEASKILAEVLALPPDERAQLVEKILDSLGAEPDKERLERWAAEAESRLDAIDRGELDVLPGEEVFERLRQRYS
ncbi:MAG: addiction module protein [Pyrinomonadaceae bacterium]